MAKKRKAKKQRNPKRKAARKSKRSRSSRRPRKNTRIRKRSSKRTRRPKRNPATSSSYTVVFPSSSSARDFIESFPSKSVRAAYRKELTPIAHGAGFKSWRVSRATADRMATQITQRLAYEAGRRRRRFTPPKLRIVARA